MAKKKKEDEGVKGDWIVTYSDMVTLLLCFFVALFDTSEIEPGQLADLLSAISSLGMGSATGGDTNASGKNVTLGNTINSLPSMEAGSFLGLALKKAVSLFTPEVKSQKITVTHDERGVVINLAADAFFSPGSAKLNLEEARDVLLRAMELLNSSEIKDKKFRIEGHTDAEPVDPAGPWESNWDLSMMRSLAILHHLTALGVDENRFQVAGFADTVPIARNDTPEGRAYNRRVDIIILDEGHL
ncbi:MAG: flagellar motor protein MotB [Spirochaetaceae bacterium]|jgi:chemotaxis protein MotB|nr:flagellar motor protein MotB [Spirochaetaceae bacterium]